MNDDLAPQRNIGGLAIKATLSTIPIIGPIVGEIIGELIPNYRAERLEQVVRELQERVAGLDPQYAHAQMTRRVFVDLLEDGVPCGGQSHVRRSNQTRRSAPRRRRAK